MITARDYERNPVIEKVVEKNEEVRCAVRKNACTIRQYAGRELTETELGYITVHICAAIERKRIRKSLFMILWSSVNYGLFIALEPWLGLST